MYICSTHPYLLHCRGNAYSSLYLSHFVKDFCKTVQARVVIFGIEVDNDVLYHGIVNQPSHSFSSL